MYCGVRSAEILTNAGSTSTRQGGFAGGFLVGRLPWYQIPGSSRIGSGNFETHGKDGGSAGETQGLKRPGRASFSASSPKLVVLPNGDLGSIQFLCPVPSFSFIASAGAVIGSTSLSYPERRDATTNPNVVVTLEHLTDTAI